MLGVTGSGIDNFMKKKPHEHYDICMNIARDFEGGWIGVSPISIELKYSNSTNCLMSKEKLKEAGYEVIDGPANDCLNHNQYHRVFWE
jgi:hypothetical protein